VSAALPPSPDRRSDALISALAVLRHDGSPADPVLDLQLAVLSADAAHVTGMRRGTVNLLDGSRQCQIGAHGFLGGVSPQETSVCAQLTATAPDVYAFADLGAEPGFAGNPWVDGRLAAVRAYASAPVSVDGVVVGTLCVFDDDPRELTLEQCDRLVELAGRVSAVLAARLPVTAG
jgi:GAF domain-containing protein